jgi:hypothetical protein
MEALRQSVKAEGGKQPSATRAQSKKAKKRIEGQREMLLRTARPSGRHRS